MRSSSFADSVEAQNMIDSLPAWAATTPPETGASTNSLSSSFRTACAMVREVVGSMVEESMKRRSWWSFGSSPFVLMEAKTSLTIFGEGRQVMMTV